MTGFSFGADPSVLYVASRDLLDSPDRSTARLHVSHDGGRTWAATEE